MSDAGMALVGGAIVVPLLGYSIWDQRRWRRGHRLSVERQRRLAELGRQAEEVGR